MAQIISFVNQKGGVGKTTSSVNVASYLADFGRRVLLVDADPQANASSALGVNQDELKQDLYDVLCGRCALEAIILKSALAHLEIAPSSPRLAGANIELVNIPSREFLLANAIKTSGELYDYIILDAPPALGILTINALTASQHVIIPVQCEYFALVGLSQLLGTIDLVQRNLNPNLGVMGVVLTMRDRKTKIARDVVREVQRNFPGKVFESIIPRNVRLAEAPSFGVPILNYEPHCKGAKAYKHLAQEIIKIQPPVV